MCTVARVVQATDLSVLLLLPHGLPLPVFLCLPNRNDRSVDIVKLARACKDKIDAFALYFNGRTCAFVVTLARGRKQLQLQLRTTAYPGRIKTTLAPH